MYPARETARSARRQREPEHGVLHHVLREHLLTFLARAGDLDGSGLPRFVTRELQRALTCGILAHGFARVRCTRCGEDELVAFSCKGRGFCHSCGGRRMANTAALRLNAVLSEFRVRQWVLSFPYRVRFLLAFDPALCSAVRGIFVRTLLGWLRELATAAGTPGRCSGAAVLLQRFGSVLNLNLHFRAPVLDGVYASQGLLAPPRFQPAQELTNEDVVHVTRILVRRIVRHLQHRGRLPRPDQAEHDELESDEPLLALLAAGLVQGCAGSDPPAACRSCAVAASATTTCSLPGELCCDLEGFSLHAKVAIEGHDRAGLERLCRYIARPAIASERLSLGPDGRVVYRLRRALRGGTSAIVFELLVFLERLAALVPRPRVHLLTYHGVLAPAAQWRNQIVPARADSHDKDSGPACAHGSPTAPAQRAPTRRRRST